MACGVPVVSTDVGAIGEIVRDGETGIMVPPRDVAALATALARLAADEALRARLATAGRAAAEERFSMTRMLEGMEAVFIRALADTPR
jgi:glycosyltransferase involved in cell wall biosynthesis